MFVTRYNFDAWQLIRFGIIGTLTAGIYFAGYNFLRWAELMSPGQASALCYLAAITFQYFGHSLFTFSRAPRDLAQIGRFIVLNIIGISMTVLVTLMLTSLLGAPDWLASATIVVMLPVLNWIIMKAWVFA